MALRAIDVRRAGRHRRPTLGRARRRVRQRASLARQARRAGEPARAPPVAEADHGARSGG
eukprot:867766-Prymnesium_polylepis.1